MTKYYHCNGIGGGYLLIEKTDDKFFVISRIGVRFVPDNINQLVLDNWIAKDEVKEVTEELAKQILADYTGSGKTKEEKIALLLETSKAYTLATRSADGPTCRYFKEDTIGCGVSRLIKDKELCKKLDAVGSTSGAGICNDHIFNLLPEEVKVYGKNLLLVLQRLHDIAEHWTEEGLSPDGIREVNQLEKLINDGQL